MTEIFKDISNYEGLYKISNFGNVKSKRKTAGGYIWKYKEVNYYVKDNSYNG